jgi:hypothetical protein
MEYPLGGVDGEHEISRFWLMRDSVFLKQIRHS